MTEDSTEEKEAHRLGTINRWDPPEGDWAADHDWTRYRGPSPWPVPGGWVFKGPEGGGRWQHYGDLGVGHHNDNSIVDALEEDDSVDRVYDALDEARGDIAHLSAETANPDEVSVQNPEDEKIDWTLDVAGEQVFRRVDPDRPDLMAAVAEALAAYHAGELQDRVDGIIPESGEKPSGLREEEKVEQRRRDHRSLGDFS